MQKGKFGTIKNQMFAASRPDPESEQARFARRALRCVQITTFGFFCLIALMAPPAVLATGVANSVQPDLAREKRMADQIVDAILDGEAIGLTGESDQHFLGIYTLAADPEAVGTVIVLHGRGFHPDWTDVVQPLRVALTEHAWHTLSIQLPVLAKSAQYNDYWHIFDAATPRIDAAIARARELHAGRVVLVAHSCGAHMALRWVRNKGRAASDAIDAFVGIGMGATDFGQPMREPFAIDLLTVPVLDLYAERDFPAVHGSATQRREGMRRGGNDKSAQIVVPDADHYFVDRGDALVEVLAAWLGKL